MSAEREYDISKEQFMKILVDFVTHMDDINSFLDYALPSRLLDDGQKNDIMSERNPDDQKRKLHDYLLKKLPRLSDKLMSALEKSKHDVILDLLAPSVYPMTFKPHGRVIVINNIKFDDMEKYKERHGSEKDVEGITELFASFNFDVKPFSNKTAEEMEDIIVKEAAESTAREDCFVMFLMSHGVTGHIIGTDGQKLSYSTINTILRDSSQLKNKPKLIYINTCQAKSDGKTEKKYFDVPDLHVAFATVPDRLAYRTCDIGSYFIESLLSVYERNKEKCDISSLSHEINARVAEKKDETAEKKEQISSSFSTLKKKVILRATD